MTFGDAIEILKAGGHVARAGWNGRDMFLYLLDDIDQFEPCIVMFTAQKKHQPGWLASQPDMLSQDWEEVTPGVRE